MNIMIHDLYSRLVDHKFHLSSIHYIRESRRVINSPIEQEGLVVTYELA
jgi:hypothetical protein